MHLTEPQPARLSLQSAAACHAAFAAGTAVLAACVISLYADPSLAGTAAVAVLAPALTAALFYAQLLRPLARRAVDAEQQIAEALRKRQEKGQELSTALAQRTAHQIVLDRHAIVSETDLDGRFTYVNDRFIETTQYTREELYGRNYSLLSSGAHPSAFWTDMYKRLMSGEVWQGEICNKRKDGSLYWVHATNSAIRNEGGRITGFVSVRLDITETKQREQALKSAQDQLEQERAKAEAASSAKSSFLSTMSHEMRTPLNGILGALDLLRNTGLDGKQTQLVNIAHESGDALLVHIDDVLDFSKMEAGKLELEPHPFHLARMVNSVLHIVGPQAEQRSNRLSSAFAGHLPTGLDGDHIRVRQVLLNLVSNANKFTMNGRIVVDVSRVGGSDAFPEIEVAVSDTGIGIPQSRIKDLFQEFSMLDSSFTRKTSGTGLGLAISKRLIEAMGGTIGVESIEGRGTRFWFRLSLPPIWSAAPRAEDGAISSIPKIPTLKILLADDNGTNQLVASQMLIESGHQVVTVANGRQAVEAAGREHFDLVLTDISMPEMDGIEASQRIRALPAPYCNVPIVALTANAISGDRERFLAAGMNEYITKPVRRATLETCLAALFERRAGAARAITAPADAATAEPLVLDPSELRVLAVEASPEAIPIVVGKFLAELKKRREEIDASAGRHEPQRLEKVVHAIAGASASVGAACLRKLSHEIEAQCRAGNGDRALVLAERLPRLMRETEAAFTEYLSRMAIPKSAA